MDTELTLHELGRLEAQRKLRELPAAIVETAWVREAQIEAVIDAVLAVALGGEATARARHTGEWCARIAGALPNGPDPSLARRVGVLSDIAGSVLERIAELRHIARYMDGGPLTLIARIAREFDERISPDEHGRCASPNLVLRAMNATASDETRPIVQALEAALHPARHARVA